MVRTNDGEGESEADKEGYKDPLLSSLSSFLLPVPVTKIRPICGISKCAFLSKTSAEQIDFVSSISPSMWVEGAILLLHNKAHC